MLTPALQPKPPPMKGAITCRSAWDMSRALAIRFLWAKGDWELPHRVTRPLSSTLAMATWGSIGTCCTWGMRKLWRTTAAASERALSTSPLRILKWFGMLVPLLGKMKLATS